MGKGKNNTFWESAANNASAYRDYYNNFMELAVSMFEWQNLPPSVDPRFLELTLLTDGKVLFFVDDGLDQLIVTRCTERGDFNIYNEPITRDAYAIHYHNTLSIDNSVLCYNNYLRQPSVPIVRDYARRLWEFDRTIDVNVAAQKTPILVSCDETDRLTLKNLYMKYNGNEPVIFAERRVSPNSLKVLSTGAPFVADRLYTLRTQIYNEGLTKLGISNTNFTKKERLLVDEVTRNQGGVIANRYSRLLARQDACKRVNKMFGTKIWCDFRDDYRLLEDTTDAEETADEGVKDSE